MSLFSQIGKQAADEFASNSSPSFLKNTLIGGGLGGVAGGLYGLINPGTTEKIDEKGNKVVKQKSRLREGLKRGLIGAGLGGLSGAAIGALSDNSSKKTEKEPKPKPAEPKSTIGGPDDAGADARLNFMTDQRMSNEIDILKNDANKYLENQIKAIASGDKENAKYYGDLRAGIENRLTSPTTLDMLQRALNYKPKGIYSIPSSKFALPMPESVEAELYGSR